MRLGLPARARALALPLALLAGSALARPAAAQQLVIDLSPRSGVTLRYLALPPAGTPPLRWRRSAMSVAMSSACVPLRRKPPRPLVL